MGMLPLNQIVQGDCREVMRSFPAESIDMVIFSPPYYGLRNYGEAAETIWGGDKKCKHEWMTKLRKVHSGTNAGEKQLTNRGSFHNDFITKDNFCVKCGAWKGQLGLEPSWRMYIEHLVEVCGEIRRVLKKTGSMYINIGDTYAGSHQGYGQKKPSKTGFQFIGKGYYAASIMKPPQSKTTDYKPKCLMGIPWRLAFALIEDSWILRNEIIWHKPNAMPSSVKDRLTVTHEKIFHFVKQRKYYYNLDAIREPHKSSTIKRIEFTLKHPERERGGLKKILAPKYRGDGDPRVLLINKNWARALTKHDLAVGRLRNFSYPDPLHTKAYNIKGKNPGDVFLKQDHVPSRNINIYKGFNARYQPRIDGKNPGDFWSITTKTFS